MLLKKCLVDAGNRSEIIDIQGVEKNFASAEFCDEKHELNELQRVDQAIFDQVVRVAECYRFTLSIGDKLPDAFNFCTHV